MTTQTEKWSAGNGAGLTWTDAFGAGKLNSLLHSQSLLSDIQIDNSTALDQFCDVSGHFVSAGSFGSTSDVILAIYPLNSDNTTYGDGKFTTAAAGGPAGIYYAGTFPLNSGTTQEAIIRQIPMPPGKFKFLLWMPSTVAGNTDFGNGTSIQYRTYNRKLV